MHFWGDPWFQKYGNTFYKAIEVLEDRIHKWAKCGVCGKEKYGCYTETTEVLTKSGWKSIKDVTLNDEVVTLKDGEYIEYNKPIDIIKYHYEGKMYKLVNRGMDILVTPNHNLYIAKGSYYKNGKKRKYPFELTNPSTYFNKDKRFKKNGIWNGALPEEFFTVPKIKNEHVVNRKSKIYKRIITHQEFKIKTTEFLKFLGFYVAEGSTCGQGQINIAHNPYTESELATTLINNIGFKAHSNKQGTFKYFSSIPLSRWIEENCGRGAKNKRVPTFIKNLDKDSIRLFLEYLYIGDGHKTKTSNVLTTISKQLSDDVCELILKCGDVFRVSTRKRENDKPMLKTGRIIKQQHPSYEINWLKNKEIEIEMTKVNKGCIKNYIEEWVDYNGDVYCCTIPNHIMYVRQNGKGYWCGNSYRDDFFQMWNGELSTIFFGYKLFHSNNWFEKLIWKIDNRLIPVKKTKFGWYKVGLANFNRVIGLVKLVNKWQARMLNKAVQITCKEFPDVVGELLMDVCFYKCIKPCKWGNIDGEEIHNNYWKSL